MTQHASRELFLVQAPLEGLLLVGAQLAVDAGGGGHLCVSEGFEVLHEACGWGGGVRGVDGGVAGEGGGG